MSDNKIFFMFVGVCLLLLISAIICGAVYHSDKNSRIKTHCRQTEMYVIGNKSRSARVYDCKGVGIK